jgi:H+-transporting ATPase
MATQPQAEVESPEIVPDVPATGEGNSSSRLLSSVGRAPPVHSPGVLDRPPVASSPAEITGGLTSAEVRQRRAQYGPNSVREEKPHLIRQYLGRFWSPIAWLLEATIVIQLFLGERVEAGIVGGLLVLNAILGLLEEGRAHKALELLRQKLRVDARVRRDGQWMDVAAAELVPGDVVHLRQGRMVPADVRLLDGSLLVDQSALTGESAAVSVSARSTTYAGSMVRSGEGTSVVTAIGSHTFFGKTAELVRIARPVNRQEHEIVAVVRNLFVIGTALGIVVLGMAHLHHLPLTTSMPLVLTLLLATIPVALPTTFTLAAALGSLELSRFGVLVTRLSALHDIAAMTVLCSDKTGTLTRNEAVVSVLKPAEGVSENELLRAAALASDPAGQDPVDRATVAAAAQRGLLHDSDTRTEFIPFDPAKKRAEAVTREPDGLHHFLKGAPAVIAALCSVPEQAWLPQAQEIAAHGQRVLAVATGRDHALRFAGLMGLEDAVREDSRQVVGAIQAAGVRVVMVTGDNELTARAVAEAVGIPVKVCPPEKLRGDLRNGTAAECSVFAGVFPEDKFRLVRAIQRHGAVVGMSGDGVNDAPALRQAEAGVAVANATDVAKAAAAIVLTRPGLSDLVPAIAASRRVFQRVTTYTLNMLSKKVELMFLLVAAFLLTGHKALTPLLMVLIIFLNDFLTMSIATDQMSVSQRPNRWHTRSIALAGGVLGLCRLCLTFGIFAFGHYALTLDTPHLQSLTFATVLLSSQAGVYLLRERGPWWTTMPSRALLWSTALGVGATAALALGGIFMAALSPVLLLNVAAVTLLYFLALDWFKVWLFARLNLR